MKSTSLAHRSNLFLESTIEMEKPRKILLRANGSAKTGLGHFYRIFALYSMFKSDSESVLVTAADSWTNAIPQELNYCLLPENISIEQEIHWISKKYPSSDYLFFADGYQFDEAYQFLVKKEGYKLLYIDDLMAWPMHADWVINHALSANSFAYSVDSTSRVVAGTAYAILRPAFQKASQLPVVARESGIYFVCFGGADPMDLSVKATQALLTFPSVKKVHVVIGAAYIHQTLSEIEKVDSRVEVHRNVDEALMAELMLTSTFGIVSASTTLYEACACRLPVLCGYYVDNQVGIYNGALRRGFIYPAGDMRAFTVNKFHAILIQALSHEDDLKIQQLQAISFDGRSAKRIQQMIETDYRRATINDVKLIYDWSNDPITRANSYSSEPILFENHVTWFSNKLMDKNSYFYIAEFKGYPAGLVRYEIKGDHAVVGILVGEDYRGKGLATEFLRGSGYFYFKENDLPVFAYIKTQNKASIGAFERAGYSFVMEEEVQGFASYVYKIEKNQL